MNQPDWDSAPEGATHWCKSNQNAKWYRRNPDGIWNYYFCGKWERSRDMRDGEINLTNLIPRYAPTHPPGATHTRNSDGRFFKAGPYANARLWSTYNSLPAWICASSTTNLDLCSSERFTRIEPQQPTTDTEQFTMSAEQAQALALENRPMKVVEVRFQRADGAKTYHYYAPADAKSGDYAVVYASDNIVTGRDFPFTVVQITNDEVIDTQRATKAILGTFNEDFAKHVQARIEHMARVKAKLQTKKKAFEESAFFEMLAKSDPEAAALLEELKSFRM